jgi:AT-rich interactive domain-containing protein 1
MSLKSGLLADSTWALDTLTILLHDESTYGYFNLKHHHSLLDTIVSHFKVLLSSIFDIVFEDAGRYRVEGRKISAVQGEAEPNQKSEDGKSDENAKNHFMTELLASACQTDYDVLSEVGSRSWKDGGDDGSVIPVASIYSPKDIKMGKSDDLTHIGVPTLNDPVFPQEDLKVVDIVSEAERLKMEAAFLLQRVDQTPVSTLLKREALLTKIPLHRFGRLSHSPRRRERNFFGDMRRRESMSIGGDKPEETGATEECSSAPAAPEIERDENRADNKCKSPESFQGGDRRSTSSSPIKKDIVPSPIMREESEVFRKEELPLWTMSPTREDLESRCKCISNILRSLTFVPGNDVEFCQHPGILIILGKLLMLHHYHLLHSKEKRKVAPAADGIASDGDDAMESDNGFDVRKVDDQQFPPAKDYWWWQCLDVLREDTLVILANISGQLDLSIFPEKISFPIIDGLLHWLVCPSSIACDPLPDSSKVYSQSPQRLVVETLAKMTISEVNVDLILATPPLMRLDLLFSHLGQMIGQKKHPVVRQFALVLLSNLAQGNEAASRLIGQQKMVMSLLLECLEVSEQMTCMGQNTIDGGYGKDDPTSLSVAMLRRAASTLHYLSRVPANRTAFLPYKDRVLYLSTSQYVEPSVSSILMDMLFEFGKL